MKIQQSNCQNNNENSLSSLREATTANTNSQRQFR